MRYSVVEPISRGGMREVFLMNSDLFNGTMVEDAVAAELG